MSTLKKILLIVLFPLFMNATDNNIIKIREMYYKAAVNKADAETFFNFMQKTTGENKYFLEAYKGLSFMIKANFAFNPYYKLSYFLKGKELLDNAINMDPKNTELRFLRYCVQTNAPVFLAYSGKIDEDKNIIKNNFNKLVDADLKSRIKEYMLDSKNCSREEKQIFN